MAVLSDLAIRAANNPSTFASNDRATRSKLVAPLSVDNNTTILASSPSPTGSVQSLQARLLAARKKNELLEEIERGVDADGYPFCEYRKGFWDHLKGKSLIISVSRNNTELRNKLHLMTRMIDFAREFHSYDLSHLIHSLSTLQTVRVSLQQATTILVSFISEQLELDLKRNIKVNEGELTQLEADLEAEEWEKVRFIFFQQKSTIL